MKKRVKDTLLEAGIPNAIACRILANHSSKEIKKVFASAKKLKKSGKIQNLAPWMVFMLSH